MAFGADRAVERPRFSRFPFSLCVASGAPLPDGVVLWTRLAPEPLRGGGAGDEPVAVRWEVADDESFARVVRRGSATARPAGRRVQRARILRDVNHDPWTVTGSDRRDPAR